jgi:hypothetical protein
MRTCKQCGSDDIGTAIMGRSFDHVRKGAKRFDACRECGYWEVSVATRDTTKDGDDWFLVGGGQSAQKPRSKRQRDSVGLGRAKAGVGRR